MNRIVTTGDYLGILTPCVDLIASTLGPYGKNVHFWAGEGGGPLTYRDGYMVAKMYQPIDDKTANVVSRVRNRAKMTVDAAGDSSTSTAILLKGIYSRALEVLRTDPSQSPRMLAVSIKDAAKRVIDVLKSDQLIPVDTLEKLLSVTTLAAGNDPVLGKKIAELVWAVGKTGVITVEPGEVQDVECEKIEGFQLEGGAYHESMVVAKGGVQMIENPWVLLIDEARDWDAVKPMIGAWMEMHKSDGRPLIVVSRHLEGSALSTMIRRTAPGPNGSRIVVPIYCVKVDIAAGANVDDLCAAVTGGKHFSLHNGISVKEFNPKSPTDFFGTAKKVAINMKRAVFYGGGVSDAIERREKELEELKLSKDQSEDQRLLISKRIAAMRSNVGRVVFPITTQGETTFKYEVLMDAYLAAQSAFRDGAIPGCGLGLWAAAAKIMFGSDPGGCGFLYKSCGDVFIQLLRNGGISEGFADKLLLLAADTEGLKGKVIKLDHSALSKMLEEEYPDFVDPVESGIVDAFGAVSAALHNAAAEAAEWIETHYTVLPQ